MDFPSGVSRTYTYAVPAHLTLSPGCLVLVPFGARTLPGLVFSLTSQTAVEQPREIVRPLSQGPLLSPGQMEMARWISRSYLSPLYEASAVFLPPRTEPHPRTTFQATGSPPPRVAALLSKDEQSVYGFIAERGPTDVAAIKKTFARLRVETVLGQLLRKRLLSKTEQVVQPQARPRGPFRLELAQGAAGTSLRGSKARALLDLLEQAGGSLTLAEAQRRLGAIAPALAALERDGLVRRIVVEARDEPASTTGPPVPDAVEITASQRLAWETLDEAFQSDGAGGPRVFLLHGVTGSGKTEIYLLALAAAVRKGRQGIILVPEIALTPQTVQRFAARFPGRVAVLHSGLSATDQYGEWERIREGRVDVVVGSRSAIFAPVPDLGLIVMDEEHEWTYKQDLQGPRYHTRDVAIRLAQLTGAVLIMGSATPDVISYFHARQGDYKLLTLPERVGESGPLPLPHVEVVDMRKELRENNRSIFSRSLQAAMKEALGKGEQAILFLNRRGAATVVLCRECGHVMQCRRCDLPLTFHSQEQGLVCHQCNLRRRVPELCPACWSDKIRYLGLGTEKVAEETASLLPGARILRWDRDVTGNHRSHEAILERFVKHQADILVGTQMIAKGLHLPLVTLVGVINADIGLHLPDFRAPERTFQVLTQVSGRAGRGPWGGRVVVQTYNPQNYALQAASTHDFQAFYEQELSFRRSRGYPPFSRLVRLVYTHTNSEACEREAFRLLGALKEEMEVKGHRGTHVVGPAPCYFSRVRGRYRWHLILRGKNPRDLLETFPLPHGWTLDVDPVSLL